MSLSHLAAIDIFMDQFLVSLKFRRLDLSVCIPVSP
jgi:hypothetical protein